MIKHPWAFRRPWIYRGKRPLGALYFLAMSQYTGQADFVISSMVMSGIGTFEAEFTATAALVISNMVFSSDATAYTSLSEAQANLVISTMTITAAGTFTAPIAAVRYVDVRQ